MTVLINKLLRKIKTLFWLAKQFKDVLNAKKNKCKKKKKKILPTNKILNNSKKLDQ